MPTSPPVAPEPIRRIFLECTHTYYNGYNTGIQRVVRNLARCCREAGRMQQVECCPVVWSLWGFIRIGAIPRNGRPAFKWIKRLTRSAYRAVAPRDGGRPSPSSPARCVSTASPAKIAPPAGGWKRRGLIFLRRMAYLLASAFCHSPLAVWNRRLRLGPGDVLLLVDASWNQPMWTAVRRARRRGCRIGLVVYDVIAITHPEWFDRPLAVSFDDWFSRALQECEFYIGISEATRREVARLERQALASSSLAARDPLPGASFKLGTELVFVKDGPVRDVMRRCFAEGRRMCLAVGTIEPRKNHLFLLDAFDHLCVNGCQDVDLLLIGRPGWECDAIMERIHRHPAYGRRLTLIEDATDAELDYAYRRASLLVVPSLAEGFGLPIIEGLARGLPVVCSDIPVFREVGGAWCRYVPLGDVPALAAAMRQGPSITPSSSDQGGKAHWPTWQASCQELLRRVLQLAAENPPEMPIKETLAPGMP